MLSRPDSGEGESGELLLPALAGKLNDIDQVTVTGAGDDVIATLWRAATTAGAWRSAGTRRTSAGCART
jgi:bifunctional ADP-heptose synthase (sugar kinase/adenylyltransferase)